MMYTMLYIVKNREKIFFNAYFILLGRFVRYNKYQQVHMKTTFVLNEIWSCLVLIKIKSTSTIFINV